MPWPRRKLFEHLVELEIGFAKQLVEREEVAAGPFQRLERFGHLARGQHRVIRGSGRTPVVIWRTIFHDRGTIGRRATIITAVGPRRGGRVGRVGESVRCDHRFGYR